MPKKQHKPISIDGRALLNWLLEEKKGFEAAIKARIKNKVNHYSSAIYLAEDFNRLEFLEEIIDEVNRRLRDSPDASES